MKTKTKTKTCGECKYFVKNDIDNGCQAIGIESHFTADICKNFDPIYKPTNGDKIRQMSDEELVEVLIKPPCFICSRTVSVECEYINCKEIILATLKQEAKDE